MISQINQTTDSLFPLSTVSTQPQTPFPLSTVTNQILCMKYWHENKPRQGQKTLNMEAQDETLSGQKLTLLLPCSHQPTRHANLVSVFLVWAAVHLCSEEAMRTEAGHPENVGARRKSSEGNSTQPLKETTQDKLVPVTCLILGRILNV